MPRTEVAHEWWQVSFPELVTAIGGGTAFSVDQLVSMLSAAEQKGEDFRIIHQNTRFIVPLGLIQEYFKDHARPVSRMSAKEELEYLRKRNAELEAELRISAGIGTELKPHPTPTPRPRASAIMPLPPLRAEDLPSREKMSIEDLRKDLKKEIEKAAPLTRESETVKRRGCPAAEAKL